MLLHSSKPDLGIRESLQAYIEMLTSSRTHKTSQRKPRMIEPPAYASLFARDDTPIPFEPVRLHRHTLNFPQFAIPDHISPVQTSRQKHRLSKLQTLSLAVVLGQHRSGQLGLVALDVDSRVGDQVGSIQLFDHIVAICANGRDTLEGTPVDCHSCIVGQRRVEEGGIVGVEGDE